MVPLPFPGDALVSGVPVSRTLLDLLVRNGNSAAGRGGVYVRVSV
jgi:hypothetical protein